MAYRTTFYTGFADPAFLTRDEALKGIATALARHHVYAYTVQDATGSWTPPDSGTPFVEPSLIVTVIEPKGGGSSPTPIVPSWCPDWVRDAARGIARELKQVEVLYTFEQLHADVVGSF